VPERVALVTGGASGIGAAVAGLLLDRGHRVAVLDLGSQSSEREGPLRLRADVTRYDEVADAVGRVVEAFGALHIVVNSAGVLVRGGIEDLDVADWRRALDVNLTGTFHVLRAAAPHLRAAGWGRVVNLTSIAGVTRVGPGNPAYGASKAGVIGLTRDCAREFGAWGVTVNAVAPGAVLTPMVSGNAEWERAMIEASPIGRVSVPEEFAGVIGFLVSEESGYVTGTTLVADGGMTSGIPIPFRTPD